MTLNSYLPAPEQTELAADIPFCSCLTIRDLYWLKFRHFRHGFRNVQHGNNWPWLGTDCDNQATQQEEDSNSLQLHGGIMIVDGTGCTV